MLGLRRRPGKTHAKLVRKELRTGLDHFAQAANHAAGGVGATMGPRVEAARERVAPAAGKVRTATAAGLGTAAATLAPLALAAREGARRARGRKPEPPPRRWPKITMLLAGGAVVGAVAALVLRHRRRQEWEEYDPSRPMDTSTPSTTSAGSAGGGMEQPHRASRTTSAEEMADKAHSAIDTARHRSGGGESTVPVGGINTAVPGRGIANPVTGLDTPSGNTRNY